MINNEMRTVTIKHFLETLNDYGEKVLSTDSTTKAKDTKDSINDVTAEMMVKQYSQTNVQDPRFVDVQYIGLTKAAISINEVVSIDGTDYMVLYVIPSGRYTQVMLKER